MSQILDWNEFYQAYQGEAKAFSAYLAKHSKEALLGCIQKESENQYYINILVACLDKDTALGRRFWHQEGPFSPTLEKGHLQKICILLENSLYSRLSENNETTTPDQRFYLQRTSAWLSALQGKPQEAINSYMSQTLDWNEFYQAYQGEAKAFSAYLAKHSKEALLGCIRKESENQDYINILVACLDKNTALGRRFWHQEGLFSPTLEKGHLEKICILLENSLYSRLSENNETTTPDQRFYLQCTSAWLSALQGKPQEAINAYNIAVDQPPTECDSSIVADVQYNVAKCLHALGKGLLHYTLVHAREAALKSVDCNNHSKILQFYKKILSSSTKEALFNAIMQVEDLAIKKQLLNEALDAKNPLCKRFREQEGLLPCKLDSGYLGKICDEVIKLQYQHRSRFIVNENKNIALIAAAAFKRNSGFFNNDIENLAKAIFHYMAVEASTDPSKGVSCEKQFSVLLRSCSKQTIFSAIKYSQGTNWKISLEKALDPNGILGARFHHQEGLKPCTTEAGTLKEIKEYSTSLRMNH